MGEAEKAARIWVSEAPESRYGTIPTVAFIAGWQAHAAQPVSEAASILAVTGDNSHNNVSRRMDKATPIGEFYCWMCGCRKGEHHAYKFNDKAISGGKQ